MNRKERENQIVNLYNEGHSCPKLERKFKIHRKTIYRILERNNISLRPPEKQKCLLCDNQIFVEKQKNKNLCGTCCTNVRRYRTKKKAVDYKGGECQGEGCGWSGDISGFDFHHLDPSEKDFELNSAIIASKKWVDVEKELDKCKLLCALCHRLEHSKFKDKLFLEAVKSIATI
jgi:hypothetical protein